MRHRAALQVPAVGLTSVVALGLWLGCAGTEAASQTAGQTVFSLHSVPDALARLQTM